MGKNKRNGSRKREGDSSAPSDGRDKSPFEDAIHPGLDEKFGDERDIGLPHTFVDGENELDTCCMCGGAGVVYGQVREGIICSGACSKAHDECRSLPPREKSEYKEKYRKDPEIKRRMQRELDEARRQSDRTRDAGFGGFRIR